MPGAREGARPPRGRRGLLADGAREVPQGARAAGRVRDADALGLPVRLRPVPGPHAALLSRAPRDHGHVQPPLPRVLRGERPREDDVALARGRGADARRARRERGRARRRAGLRRRADAPSGLLRDPRRRAPPPDPPPHGEHERDPDRDGAGLRGASRVLRAGLRGLPPVRLARGRREPRAARRRPRRDAAPRPRPARRAQPLDDARRDGQAGAQRRRDRRHRPLRALAPLGPRGHAPARAGRGPHGRRRSRATTASRSRRCGAGSSSRRTSSGRPT